jgi:hypothetical protein
MELCALVMAAKQVDALSFYVTGTEDEVELQTALSPQQVKWTAWELAGVRKCWAEVFFASVAEAEQAYSQAQGCVVAVRRLHCLVKRALTSVWVSGLPFVVYARDLFTGLTELVPGLLRVTLPRNPK